MVPKNAEIILFDTDEKIPLTRLKWALKLTLEIAKILTNLNTKNMAGKYFSQNHILLPFIVF
jgi:hypothetical protein